MVLYVQVQIGVAFEVSFKSIAMHLMAITPAYLPPTPNADTWHPEVYSEIYTSHLVNWKTHGDPLNMGCNPLVGKHMVLELRVDIYLPVLQPLWDPTYLYWVLQQQ